MGRAINLTLGRIQHSWTGCDGDPTTQAAMPAPGSMILLTLPPKRAWAVR